VDNFVLNLRPEDSGEQLSTCQPDMQHTHT